MSHQKMSKLFQTQEPTSLLTSHGNTRSAMTSADVTWGVCVCEREPKPECQKDQGRGDKREERRLGLIRALLSGLRFLSITESGTKERDGGVWLEFQRALASAALSSLGLVWFDLVGFGLFLFFPLSPNCKLCICDQRRQERRFVNQNNIDFSFAAFISSW